MTSLFQVDAIRAAEAAKIEQQRRSDEQTYLSTRSEKRSTMVRHDSLFDDEEDEDAAEKLAESVTTIKSEIVERLPTPSRTRQYYVSAKPGQYPALFALQWW